VAPVAEELPSASSATALASLVPHRICCSSPRQLARDVQLSTYDAGPRQRCFEFEDFQFVASLSGHPAHFDGELAPFASLL
jgi:hypothetical protein